MHVLSIVGSADADQTTLAEQLVDRLSERGTVGTVTVDGELTFDVACDELDRYRSAGAFRTYGVSETGWVGTGEGLDLETALDRLGQTCEYVVVIGDANATVPTVVVGDREIDHGDVLARAESRAELDVNEIVSSLRETEPYETLTSLVAKVKRSSSTDRAGAIATFTGRVREKDAPDDEPTELLEFEKYDGVAEQKMARIREELEAREGVYEVRLHHKTGVVDAGEDIVFVVVLAGHRTEAFRAVEDGIDRLKEEVPLFKKEVTVGEEFWAHER